ncbi:DoxX family protein [Kineococcus sp. NUM-3379]
MSTTTTAPRPTTAAAAGTAATAPLVLRLVTGALLLVHGLPKLADPGAVQGMVAGLGVPLPALSAWLVIAGEIGLGALLLAGLLTRVAGALTALQMGLIFLVVHLPQGLTTPTGLNGENAVLLATTGAALALTGGGRASLDALRARA